METIMSHFGPWGLVLLWPSMAVLYKRLAKREEAQLEAEFGEPYRKYPSRTLMFIPFPRLMKQPAEG